jgi:hypothetical protein
MLASPTGGIVRKILACSLLCTACKDTPDGTWTSLSPVLVDGSSYSSDMTVDKGGNAVGTLNFAYGDSLGTLQFAATWVQSDDTVTFDLTCGGDCAYVMSCTLVETMACSLIPDVTGGEIGWRRTD